MSEQLYLLAGVEHLDRPYKDARKVSKQLIRELRDSGYVKRSGQRVLVALETYHRRKQHWPTPAELTRFMFECHWIPREESRYVAPRLTELIHGEKVWRHGQQLVRGGDACDQLPARKCTVTDQKAHPVAIREAGSIKRRVA